MPGGEVPGGVKIWSGLGAANGVKWWLNGKLPHRIVAASPKRLAGLAFAFSPLWEEC
jgi:hypothetical protein